MAAAATETGIAFNNASVTLIHGMSRPIGAAAAEDSDETAAKKFLSAETILVEELETPTLEDYGVDRAVFFANIENMAHDALESGPNKQ